MDFVIELSWRYSSSAQSRTGLPQDKENLARRKPVRRNVMSKSQAARVFHIVRCLVSDFFAEYLFNDVEGHIDSS
jgi:hypothetical protein